MIAPFGLVTQIEYLSTMKYIFLAAVLCDVAGSACAQQDALVLEKAATDYRRNIRQGEVVLKHSFPDSPSRDRQTTIWFDNKKIRCDSVFRGAGDPQPHREINCRFFEYDGQDFFFHYEEKRPGRPEVSASAAEILPNPQPGQQMILDPRLLGLVPVSAPNLSSERLDAMLTRPDRVGSKVVADRWQDQACWRVEFDTLKGVKVRLWIVPAWGHGVAKVDITFVGPPNTVSAESVESEFARFGAAGIWFPKKCHYRQTVNGKLIDQEVVEVTVKSLNQPIPAVVFTLAGMDIPKGTSLVVGGKRPDILRWDGQATETHPLKNQTAPLNPTDAGKGAVNTKLLAASVSAALLGAGALVLYFRRKTSG
jgi:hypothetical protein